MFENKKVNINNNRDDFKEELLEDELYQKEFLPILEVLKPDDEPIEEYANQVMADLFESVKKIQGTQGRIIEHDEKKTLAEVKELLLSRVKAVLDDNKRYRYKDNKKLPDEGLIRRSKIALLLAGDQSDLMKYRGNEDNFPSKLDFDGIRHYLGYGDYGIENKGKISERELDQLVEAGFGKQLSSILSWSSKYDKIEAVPESLFLEMIKNNGQGFWLNSILKQIPSKDKYSRKVFKELVVNGYSHVVLRMFEYFKGVDFKEAVEVYDPGYPYGAREMISKLSELDLSEKEFEEKLDYIIKHQKITTYEFDIPQINEKYGEVISKVKSIREEVYNKERGCWIKTSVEKALPVAKDIIKDGNIGFLHEQWRCVKKLAETDYDWLLTQVKKYDQEHLLMRYDNLLKKEDQLAYAKKLINQGKELLLVTGTMNRKGNRNIFTPQTLDQEVYDALARKGFKLEPNYFTNLNEETFEKLKQENPEYFFGKELIANIDSFSFKDSVKYKKYIDYQEALKNNGIRKLLISLDSFFDSRINSILDKISDSNKEEQEKYANIFSVLETDSKWLKIFYKSVIDYSFRSSDPLASFTKFGSAIRDFDSNTIDFTLQMKGGRAIGDTKDIIEKGLTPGASKLLSKCGEVLADSNVKNFLSDLLTSSKKNLVVNLGGEKTFDRFLTYNRDQQNEFINFVKSSSDNFLDFSNKDFIRPLLAYVNIVEDLNNISFSSEQKNKILELFNGSYRDECLKEMSAAWREFLEDQTTYYCPPNLALVGEAVEKAGGAGNLKFIEILGNLINQVEASFINLGTADRTKREIKNLLSTQEKKFDKERWSQDEKSQFYALSHDIIEAAPSLYTAFEPLFNQLSAKEMKAFLGDIFPLHQAQLVIKQKIDNQGDPSYQARDLSMIRLTVRQLADNLKEHPEEKVKYLAGEKERLLGMIKESFKERFGIKKIPDSFSKDEIRSIQNCIRYLGNINKRDSIKEAIIAFFLSLELNNEWSNLRENKPIKIEEYFSEQQLKILQPILEEKMKNSALPLEVAGISKKQAGRFQELLQEDIMSNMVGSIETIDIKLGNIKRNIEELADPDIYTKQIDKDVIGLLISEGKQVGSVLAKIYGTLEGKSIVLNEGEESVKAKLAEAFKVGIWSKEEVKEIQEQIQPLSLVVNMIGKMDEEKVEENIEDLRLKLIPSDKVIEIFNKLGESFSQTSGVLALGKDITYLESLLVKDEAKISPDEKETVDGYLQEIREKMKALESTLDKIKDYFVKIKKSSHLANHELLKDRLAEVEKIISSQSANAMIVSHMTKNLNLIIENMRQCLGCLRREVNNDTNLAFGDYNKFFIINQSEKDKGSISDEIVFFLPVEHKNGNKEMSFVMDNVYGSKSSDILVGNVMSVAKKMQTIKKEMPEAKISVTVSAAAMSSVGLNTDLLQKRLQENLTNIKINSPEGGIKVNVPKSSFGDNYIEVGGGCRDTGEREIQGLIIS